MCVCCLASGTRSRLRGEEAYFSTTSRYPVRFNKTRQTPKYSPHTQPDSQYLGAEAAHLLGGRCSRRSRPGRSWVEVSWGLPLRRKTTKADSIEMSREKPLALQTYRVHRPRVTLLAQIVLHFRLQPHAVAVLPYLQREQAGSRHTWKNNNNNKLVREKNPANVAGSHVCHIVSLIFDSNFFSLCKLWF